MITNNKSKIVARTLLGAIFSLNNLSIHPSHGRSHCDGQHMPGFVRCNDWTTQQQVDKFTFQTNGAASLKCAFARAREGHASDVAALLFASWLAGAFNFYYSAQVMLIMAFLIFTNTRVENICDGMGVICACLAEAIPVAQCAIELIKMCIEAKIGEFVGKVAQHSPYRQTQEDRQQNERFTRLNMAIFFIALLFTQRVPLIMIAIVAGLLEFWTGDLSKSDLMQVCLFVINAFILCTVVLLPLLTYVFATLLSIGSYIVGSWYLGLLALFSVYYFEQMRETIGKLTTQQYTFLCLSVLCLSLYMIFNFSILTLLACLAISAYKAYGITEGNKKMASDISAGIIVCLALMAFYCIAWYMFVTIAVNAILFVLLNCNIVLIKALAWCVYYICCFMYGALMGVIMSHIATHFTPMISKFLEKNAFNHTMRANTAHYGIS